jgi:hypothetical protein
MIEKFGLQSVFILSAKRKANVWQERTPNSCLIQRLSALAKERKS